MSDGGGDEMLVRRLVAGEGGAFEELVRRYEGRVGLLAGRLLGWEGDVEDVVQEVFVRAWSGLRRFRGGSRVETWLMRIVINTCRTHRRRRVLRLRVLREVSRNGRGAVGRSAVTDAMDSETFGRVRRAVAGLPGRYREVVVLRYLEEMAAKDVCEVLGISRNVLDVRLSRARGRLKDALDGLV